MASVERKSFAFLSKFTFGLQGARTQGKLALRRIFLYMFCSEAIWGSPPSAPRLSQSLVHIPTHACLARPWGLGLVLIMGNTLLQEQIGCIALPQTTSPED